MYVKFADEQVIFANSRQGLQRLGNSLITASVNDRKVKVKKTKIKSFGNVRGHV